MSVSREKFERKAAFWVLCGLLFIQLAGCLVSDKSKAGPASQSSSSSEVATVLASAQSTEVTKALVTDSTDSGDCNEGDTGLTEEDVVPGLSEEEFNRLGPEAAMIELQSRQAAHDARKVKAKTALAVAPQAAAKMIGVWGRNANIILSDGQRAAESHYQEYRFKPDGRFSKEGAHLGKAFKFEGNYRVDGETLTLSITHVYEWRGGKHVPKWTIGNFKGWDRLAAKPENYRLTLRRIGEWLAFDEFAMVFYKGLRWIPDLGYQDASGQSYEAAHKAAKQADPAKQRLIAKLPYQAKRFNVDYNRSGDFFSIQIQEDPAEQVKKEAIAWLRSQGVTPTKANTHFYCVAGVGGNNGWPGG